jgi:RNA polymerase sigma-70 factor (ECF subfamily)
MPVQHSTDDPEDVSAVAEPMQHAIPSQRTTIFDKDLMDILPHMRSFAQFLTRDHDKSKDLIQDAIVRILRAQHHYEAGTNFKAWVFTILRNLHINNFRAKLCDTVVLDDSTGIILSVPADQHSVLEFHALQRALLKLPPELRDVLILVGAEGFSYEEAAVICGCAIGTIKSRMSRGRDAIYRLLGGLPGNANTEAMAPRRPSLTQVWPRAGGGPKTVAAIPFPAVIRAAAPGVFPVSINTTI